MTGMFMCMPDIWRVRRTVPYALLVASPSGIPLYPRRGWRRPYDRRDGCRSTENLFCRPGCYRRPQSLCWGVYRCFNRRLLGKRDFDNERSFLQCHDIFSLFRNDPEKSDDNTKWDDKNGKRHFPLTDKPDHRLYFFPIPWSFFHMLCNYTQKPLK